MRPEVYEQLARSFLVKKQTKSTQKSSRFFLIISGIAALIILIVLTVVLSFFVREKTLFVRKSLYVGLDKTPVKIPYNFNNPNSGKIKAVSFSLRDVDISKYRFLDFRVRLINKTNIGSSVKVQLENSFKEISSTYVSGVMAQWGKFSIPLSDFKRISDLSTIQSLSFMLEDWNLADKENQILIDEIRFVK